MMVRITRAHELKARLEREESGFILVTPYLENCNLQFRVSIRVRRQRTATRLAKAIEAGVALTDVSVQRDLFEEQYLASTLRVRMHSINLDLVQLGF
jgi:hypothetical protein